MTDHRTSSAAAGRSSRTAAKPGSLAVLGSTGSVGTQTLEVVRQNPDELRVISLAAMSNIEVLEAQAKEFRPEVVAVDNPEAGAELARRLGGSCTVIAGDGAAERAALLEPVHTVVAAVVGFAGLRSTIAALEAGKHVALANKEAAVAGGALLRRAMDAAPGMLVPVDSEHSGLFQCLLGRTPASRSGSTLRRVHLTASGGPFLSASAEEMARATPAQALKHPRWEMGAKISIDSATMMNKGLEVIEAAVLFDLEPGQIEVLVHPQSVVHALAEFSDGSVIASLSTTDMRVPIAFALGYLHGDDPRGEPALRSLVSGTSFLELAACRELSFLPPDRERFPALDLCYRALAAGAGVPAVLNAANEVAVDSFLRERVGFFDITGIVAAVMDRACTDGAALEQPKTIEEIIALDAWARREASNVIEAMRPAA